MMYCISNGINFEFYDDIKTVNIRFINIMREILESYVKIYNDDFGYLDLGIWIIKITDKDQEILMPSNLIILLELHDNNIYKFLNDLDSINLQEKLMGLHLKTHGLYN